MRLLRTTVMAGAAIVFAAAALAFRPPAGPLDPGAADRPPIPGTETSLARVVLETDPRALDLIVGPVTIPPHTEGMLIPVQLVQIPVDAWVHGFAWTMHDHEGRLLSPDLLHHVNLIDPDRRELFGATARRVLAAGRETSGFTMPPVLAYPFARDTRLLVAAMFSNPTSETITNAELRVRLRYSPRPRRGPEPLAVFPFHLDVMGPVGSKSFPVPPGRTVQSWEGAPATDVRVLAMGGHMHDHARLLRLEDVTTGAELWRAEPIEVDGRVVGVPRASPWRRGGLKLRRDHVYRVTIEYYNPTPVATEHGGMGLVAGVSVARAEWPGVDRDHPEYTSDLASLIAAPHAAGAGHGHGGHQH
ncbi:MAG TPA: hypothetical protein VK939_06795 [Longimicrobiales bacterium]|nr:hypothetical protein [Longimicrobiales bacterium]